MDKKQFDNIIQVWCEWFNISVSNVEADKLFSMLKAQENANKNCTCWKCSGLESDPYKEDE